MGKRAKGNRIRVSELQEARHLAHEVFDQFWKERPGTRGLWYARLARYLGVDGKDCHMSKFTIEQCDAVFEFVRTGAASAAIEFKPTREAPGQDDRGKARRRRRIESKSRNTNLPNL